MKGNRTLVRDGAGVETRYTWDSVDRLATATTPVGLATYGYFEDGLLKTTAYGATLRETRRYDEAGRLTEVEAVAPARVPSLVSRFGYARLVDSSAWRTPRRRTCTSWTRWATGRERSGWRRCLGR